MKRASLLLVVFLSLSLVPHDAFAYLDPGTGSVILQGVIGALAAIAVILKLYWHRLLRFFGLRKDLTNNEIVNKQSYPDKR